MFDITCTACSKRQLIFPSQVTAVVNDARGIVVSCTCWCGAEQTWTTGNAAQRTHRTPVAA